MAMAGEIRLFAGSFAPNGWASCDGQVLSIRQYGALYSVLGTTFGGDGRKTFGLPDLRGRIPIHAGTGRGITARKIGDRVGVEEVTLSTAELPEHAHPWAVSTVPGKARDPRGMTCAAAGGAQYNSTTVDTALSADSLEEVGGNRPHENLMPYLGVRFIISLTGAIGGAGGETSAPFLGEIRIFAGNFAPRGWLFCDGQSLKVSDNSALFSILGTTYGGDGRVSFQLPDLKGRAALHAGHGPGLSSRSLGKSGGTEAVVLEEAQLPHHTHEVNASTVMVNKPNPAGCVPGSGRTMYRDPPADADMAPAAVASAGGGRSHSNMQPFQVIPYIIALEGNYPSK